MSEKPPSNEPITGAQKLILKDLGLSAQDIETLRSNTDAKEMIEFLKAKQKPEDKKENKTPMLQLPNTAGTPPLGQLPPPATDIPRWNGQLTLFEKMNPMSVRKAYNNRWAKDARILVHITDDGNMEAF